MKKLLVGFLCIVLMCPFSFTSNAEAKVTKTIDSEIVRLSKEYFLSVSTVKAIIICESEMYGSAVNENLDKDGKVWSRDFGPFQINDFWHEKTMEKMGLDIHDQWDSLEYGFILINKQGFHPWKASRGCWLTKIKAGV